MKLLSRVLLLLVPMMAASLLSASGAEPLINTRWNQGCFYNANCPVDATATNSCFHALAGSGAVAMAQVMKFHGYPAHGSGQHSYTHPVYGNLTANFSATTYPWSTMPDSLTSGNDAVATLIFQCGVAQEMNYGVDNSTSIYSDIVYALKTYFNYSDSAVWRWKDDYTTATWQAMLKAEIDAGRPLLYYGDSIGLNGHFFVCDGYQSEDQFHMNWGWGGEADGWYNLSMLTPLNHHLSSNQGALFGLDPSTPGPYSYTMNFESVPVFSLSFTPWMAVDVDGHTTYGIENHTFPNNTEPMAFICFDPDSVTPSMGGDAALQPHTGNRFGACFSANPPSNNDWFISPKIQLGESPQFSFWVKSYTDLYGLEQFKVAISVTDSLPESFIYLTGNDPLEAPTVWTKELFNLNEYRNQKVYLAIQCISNDRFILMIDDLEIKPDASTSLTADFSASKTTVRAGDLVNFFDQSSGMPTTWSWSFNGGTPSTSTQQNPAGIRFNTVGTYTVSLTVTNGSGTASETKTNYITVTSYPSSMSLDFDSLANFTTNFLPWTTVDVGGGSTYFIGGVTFPGEGSPMSYICFNPGATYPPLVNMIPHSGEKLGCSFATMPPRNPNNKWLISPKISLGNSPAVEFWVQTYNILYGLERFNVAVSLTDTDPDSFTPINPVPESAPEVWTKMSYDLAGYSGKDVHIGFQCVSDTTFIFMIDDIAITSVAGMNEAPLNDNMEVYPNPVKEQLFVKFDHISNDMVTLRLVNSMGRLVHTGSLPGNQMEMRVGVENLPSGIYTLSVCRDGITHFRKISVIH